MDRTLRFSEIYRQHVDAVFRMTWMLAEAKAASLGRRAMAGSWARPDSYTAPG
jgi:hypothetical protein